ncbi:Uncharacterised protein [Mycobacterium tuberculosis]|nr:Uncharacterised protein [Mycobacterium tuberculosis]CKT11962.1 Uncharacterised protein [Mycobacterium tuberculosis]CKT86661.1 Uncharacterised protein [Mycobacterium tuberculosis]CKU36204.1 Uncharacterised protein [Mycobacterium tuberculosis]CKU70601.1 Uncharacterised protein [Mycobacterium tuberculosis]
MAAITAPTVVAIPSVLVKPMSAIGALSAGNVTTGSVPRAMTVVGMKSSTCWNAQCEYGDDSQLSSARPAGTPPLTPVRRAARRSGRRASAASRRTAP